MNVYTLNAIVSGNLCCLVTIIATTCIGRPSYLNLIRSLCHVFCILSYLQLECASCVYRSSKLSNIVYYNVLCQRVCYVMSNAPVYGVLCMYNPYDNNTIQYNTIRYDTIRYDTMRYNTIRYDTIQYNTIRCDAIRYDTIRYETIQCNAMQCNTIQ